MSTIFPSAFDTQAQFSANSYIFSLSPVSKSACAGLNQLSQQPQIDRACQSL
jgi:hypothetical protein